MEANELISVPLRVIERIFSTCVCLMISAHNDAKTPPAGDDGAAGLEKVKDTFSSGLKKLSLASHVIMHT